MKISRIRRIFTKMKTKEQVRCIMRNLLLIIILTPIRERISKISMKKKRIMNREL